jgi:oligoendopeptidase F
LKVAGVDLSSKDTIMDAIEMFKDTIREFEEIYNDINNNVSN